MYLKIRTKNHTAQPLKNLIEVKNRTVFRLGSITPTEEIFPVGVALNKPIVEINTAEACHNSGDKILMKQCFARDGVKTATQYEVLEPFMEDDLNLYDKTEMKAKFLEDEQIYPLIIKHKNSCKGNGIYLIENEKSLRLFVDENNFDNYIIEKYYNYSKEYRLHVTKDGCFYTCRKMLKEDAEERWHRHDMNSVWIMEENPLFDKPSNWADIEAECVKALNAVGLDIGACDIKVQSEKNKDRGGNPEFIILEINSAPSCAARTLVEYEKALRKILSK